MNISRYLQPREVLMPQMKKKSYTIRKGQDDFIKRKVGEIRRLVPPGEEGTVNESTVIQGLIDFWMAFEARRKPPDQITHKD
jgi:hypothetical protein